MTNTCEQLEVALVGSLLASPDKIVNIFDRVKMTDFTDEKAQLVYSKIVEQWRAGKKPNITSLFAELPNMGVYLAKAHDQAFPPGVSGFADEISYRARTRRVKTGLEAAIKTGGSADNMLSSVMDVYKHEMVSGKKDPSVCAVLSRFEKIVEKNRKQGKIGFATGFNVHEKLYYRYFPGHIWTMGGFTSVGKTAIMVQKICNLLTSGENAKILVVSTEMTEEQVVSRIVSNFTGIHSLRILTGNYHSEEEADAVEQIKTTLKSSPLSIYDDIYELSDIETAFRKASLQGGINVGFIDYVQNCKWSEAKSQYQEQAGMAKRFQELAKEVKATVICLSQVSNDVGRGNTEQLELKGAGEWAAVSDFSVMLTRSKVHKYLVKYDIKKNRHGSLGERLLEFRNDYTSLYEKPEGCVS